MNKKMHVCLFIGHGNAPETLYPAIFTAIGELIASGGITEFWSGGYGDFDHMCERAVREWKQKGADVKLVLALAYPPKADEDTKRRLASFDETFLPELGACPARAAIARRNSLLAHQAGHVLSGVSFSFGGAAKTLQAARSAGAVIHQLPASTARTNRR